MVGEKVWKRVDKKDALMDDESGMQMVEKVVAKKVD